MPGLALHTPPPQRMRATLLGLLCVAGLAPGLGRADGAPRNAVPLEQFPRERIAVETRASVKRALFEAWRADGPRTRAQGLMWVEDAQMRPDQAMIFVYDPPELVSMWMKNTRLSLDMLFVDARGCIVTIKERAVPESLATIRSRVPVVLVVELRSGVVAQQGIRVGDRVLRLDQGWPATTGPCDVPPAPTEAH
jgi:uncharacterized membrane protein (UPF0127 family)